MVVDKQVKVVTEEEVNKQEVVVEQFIIIIQV